MNFEGKIIRGRREGTKIGFPTANINVEKAVEPGIYAGYASLLDGSSMNLQALFYVSQTDSKAIECHLLDFPKKDLYGAKISVHLSHRLRSVKKFSNLKEAREYIKKDEQKAREWFKNNPS